MTLNGIIWEPRKGLSSIIMESELVKKSKPYVTIILMQFLYAVFAVISSTALKKGMNHYTFSVYRNTIATLVIAPFALVFERNTRPRMSFSVLYKIVLLGLLEPVIDQNLYFIGMKYTTATFATSMTNILPAITFLIAWILRLERVNVKKIPSQVKIIGTLVTLGGTMIMTFVKGPQIQLSWTKNKSILDSVHDSMHNPVKGALMVGVGCTCWSVFYNLQAIVLKSYPADLSLTAMICMSGTLQGAVLTLVAERGNYAIWSINWDIKLLTYTYGGIICSAFWYYVSGVVMKEKGPVFVTAFNPLSMVIVAVMSSFIFAEQLEVGKVLGAVVIVCGLYLVIWGKSKDPQITLSQVVHEEDQTATITPVEDLEK